MTTTKDTRDELPTNYAWLFDAQTRKLLAGIDLGLTGEQYDIAVRSVVEGATHVSGRAVYAAELQL